MNLFPIALDSPITVKVALSKVKENQGWPLTKYVKPIWANTLPGQSLEIGALKVLGKKQYFTHRKLHPDRPASTIQKSRGSMIYHYSEPRGISITELKRLGLFPDKYSLIGEITNQWSYIGNSVPPLFMKAIATQIRHVMWGGAKVRTLS